MRGAQQSCMWKVSFGPPLLAAGPLHLMQPVLSPLYDGKMQHIEFGIEPDIKVMLNPNDVANGEDTLIEAAVDLICK